MILKMEKSDGTFEKVKCKKHKLTPFKAFLCIGISEDVKSTSGATTYSNDGGYIYVVFKSLRDVSTCTHEAVHCVQFLEEWVNTKFDIETQAYMTEHVFNLLVKYLEK